MKIKMKSEEGFLGRTFYVCLPADECGKCGEREIDPRGEGRAGAEQGRRLGVKVQSSRRWSWRTFASTT